MSVDFPVLSSQTTYKKHRMSILFKYSVQCFLIFHLNNVQSIGTFRGVDAVSSQNILYNFLINLFPSCKHSSGSEISESFPPNSTSGLS